MVTANVLRRVFLIRYGSGAGTAFTIEAGRKQYLVTAKHVVKGINDEAEIDLYHEDQWKKLRVRLLRCPNPDIDIIVLIPPLQLAPTLPVGFGSDGLIISQDMYFLGFPYQLHSKLRSVQDQDLNNRFPVPFVKKGICSALDSRNKDYGLIYVDGHNNPGFSGGPVVFQHDKTKQFSIAGVVSSFLNHPDKVMEKDRDTDMIALSNAGILKAFDLRSAFDAIKASPEGVPIQ